VWENGGQNANGTSNTTNFLQSMARSMPPMLQVMRDVGGVEMPEFIAKMTPDAPKVEPTVNGHASTVEAKT